MMRNPRERWYRMAGGSLQLQARPVGLGDFGNPSLLVRRQQHIDAEAATVVRFAAEKEGDKAGLAVLQNDDNWYLLSVGRGAVAVERRAGPEDPREGRVVASVPLRADGTAVRLKIAAHGGRYDFLYAPGDGEWRPLLEGADGTILSTKGAGGFVGAVFGLYAHAAPE